MLKIRRFYREDTRAEVTHVKKQRCLTNSGICVNRTQVSCFGLLNTGTDTYTITRQILFRGISLPYIKLVGGDNSVAIATAMGWTVPGLNPSGG